MVGYGENSARLKVQVVSAHAAVRLSLERHLKTKGCRVVTADSCRKAIEEDKKELSDLIITDTSLPDLPIHEMLSSIRQYRDLMRDVVDNTNPHVLVTAPAGEELNTKRLKRLGVVARVHKPINVKTLDRYIERVIAGEFSREDEDLVSIGVLDPESRSREFFANMLNAEDVQVTPLKSILDLQALVTGSRLDILIAELVGIRDDPVSFFREYRRKCPETKIVIVSAVRDTEVHERLRELEIVRLLTKPVNPVEIRHLIREMVVEINAD